MNETKLKEKNIYDKNISWVDLSEEEILKITDISVCMYGKQSVSEEI